MFLLLAEIDAFAAAATVVVGSFVAMSVWWVVAALTTNDLEQDDEWRYDVSRINALRRLDPIYRMFQPLLQVFAKLNRAAFSGSLDEVYREIQAAGLPRFWLPEEYLARCELLALLMAPAYFFACITFMGIAGCVTAVMLTVITAWLLRRRLSKQAQQRLVVIKRRLPFFLDLLTLLMEAGASFLDSLKQAVNEFEGHPVSIEFGRVLTDMNMGKARTEAFDNVRKRLNDEEIGAIIGSIIQSEELGTPLSHIFRTQADLLRVKRSQRAETLAGEASVNMLLPGVLVMAAAVLIILGPFALNYLMFGVDF
ncbi:MAG: type II secretion system F family protein [Planctomycetaceae bacterium]|nr:type II secretion system F family protein [Planctomycetales bacterium]MCB9922646.1 type II secretion system F family protein [Planctomycetaceae bacterium]